MKQAAVAIETPLLEHSGVDIKACSAPVSRTHSLRNRHRRLDHHIHSSRTPLEAQGSQNVLREKKVPREAALAYHLAHHWTKDKMPHRDLNTIYFGEGAYGSNLPPAPTSASTPLLRHYRDDPFAKIRLRPRRRCLRGIIASPLPSRRGSTRRPPWIATSWRRTCWTMRTSHRRVQRRHRHPAPGGLRLEAPSMTRCPPTSHRGCSSMCRSSTAPGRGVSRGYRIHSSRTSTCNNPHDSRRALSHVPRRLGRGARHATGEARHGGRQRLHKPPSTFRRTATVSPGFIVQALHPATALGQGISPSATYNFEPRRSSRLRTRRTSTSPVPNSATSTTGAPASNCTIHSDNSVYAELAGRLQRQVLQAALQPRRQWRTKALRRTAHRWVSGPRSLPTRRGPGAIDPGVTPLEMAYALPTSSHGARSRGNLDERPARTTPPLRPRAGCDRQGHRPTPQDDRGEQDQPSVLSPSVASTIRASSTSTSSREPAGCQFGDNDDGARPNDRENGDAWVLGATSTSRPASGGPHADPTRR